MTRSNVILTIEIIKTQEKKRKRSEKPVEGTLTLKSWISRPSAFESRVVCEEINSEEHEQL